TGYYGNYRGSFSAADSGVNIARQQVVASLNSSIPIPFDATKAPLPSNAITNAITAGSYGYTSFTNVNSYGSSPEKAQIATVTVGAPTCTISGVSGTCAAPVSGATNPITSYNYSFPYTVKAVGQSQGNEMATILDSGFVNVVANTGLGQVTQSFAGFGMFIDQYALCGGGDLVPGTITGPVFTNGAWNFSSSGAYEFTDQVKRANSQAGYDNGSCVKSSALSANGITPKFDAGFLMGQPALPLPANDFNQREAVIDSLG